MSKQQFEDFLKREQERREPAVDWEARKEEWFGYIEKMYIDVRDWLNEYTSKGVVNIRYNKIQLSEAPIGTYENQEMIIEISDKIATLKPIGTMLIGTRGRIDLIGSRGTVRFILADKSAKGPRVTFYESGDSSIKQQGESITQINWIWKITSNPPNIRYSELNQESFLECLLEVVNG